MFLAAPYLLAASNCNNLIADGGPGWFNLLVLLLIWNALKFVRIGPVSLVLLVRVRIQEAAALRQVRRQDNAMGSVVHAEVNVACSTAAICDPQLRGPISRRAAT